MLWVESGGWILWKVLRIVEGGGGELWVVMMGNWRWGDIVEKRGRGGEESGVLLKGGEGD
jgi:hypothetical protein